MQKHSNPINKDQKQRKKISSKIIVQFTGYVKIEKNGIELKNKQSTVLSKIVLLQEQQEDNPPKEGEYLEVRSIKGEMLFRFTLESLIKIIDKLSFDGKLTLIFQHKQDRYNMFIFKSTKELLDNLVLKLMSFNNNVKNSNEITDNHISSNISKIQKDIQNPKKRKFNDLYKAKNNIKTFKKRNEISDVVPIKNKQTINYFSIFPNYMIYQIFQYLDRKTYFTKVPFLNKEMKILADSSIAELRIKDDTPSATFIKIIRRFKHVKKLCLGKAKNFKNEIIKNLYVNLKNLESLDMSEIENLSNNYIRPFLTKTKSDIIYEVKINFYLESIESALFYFYEFYKNLQILEACNNRYNYSKESLNEIVKFPKYYTINMYRALILLLNSNLHTKLNTLKIFIWNATFNIKKVIYESNAFNNNQYNPYIFHKLKELSIDIIFIEQVKDLLLFLNCCNLISFKLGQIVFKHMQSYILIEDTQYISPYYKEDSVTEDIDFDNDILEVFTKVFARMTNLKHLTLGTFLTDDLCKIISLFLKSLASIKFFSALLSDDGIKEILMNCKLIEDINLVGCDRFLGSCFFDNGFNFNKLKYGTFSITNYNFQNLFAYLTKNGVVVKNIIKRHNY